MPSHPLVSMMHSMILDGGLGEPSPWADEPTDDALSLLEENVLREKEPAPPKAQKNPQSIRVYPTPVLYKLAPGESRCESKMMFHQRNKKDVAVRTRSKAFTWGRHAQPNYCAKLLKPAEPDEVLLSCIIDDPSGHSRRRKTLSPRSWRGMTRLSPEYSVILFAASALRRQAGADAVRFPWVLAGVSNTRSRSTSLANLPTTGRDGGATNLKSECKTTRVSLRDAPHNAHRANNRVNNLLMAFHAFRL